MAPSAQESHIRALPLAHHCAVTRTRSIALRSVPMARASLAAVATRRCGCGILSYCSPAKTFGSFYAKHRIAISPGPSGSNMFPKEKLIARYARTFQLAHSINQLLTTSGTFNFTFVRPAGTTSILDVTLVSESSALGAAGGGIGDAFNLGIGTFAVGVPLPPTWPLVLVGLIAGGGSTSTELPCDRTRLGASSGG